jgi:uncharacterized protein DUF6982
MSDTRAAIRELRSLSEKRSTQGLTEQERSRLAELRERLGLPSEPAEVRAGGPQPGGTPAPAPAAPVPTAIPASPVSSEPVAAMALPRLESPEATPLPRLDAATPEPAPAADSEVALAAPEDLSPPLEAAELLTPDTGATAPGTSEAMPELEALPAEVDATSPAPDAELQAWDASTDLGQEGPAPAAPWDATTDPEIQMPALAEAIALPAEPEPELRAGSSPDLETEGELLALEPAPAEVDPASIGAVVDSAPVPTEDPLSGWAASAGWNEPQATEVAPAAAEAPEAEPAAPRGRSLAERIDAAVDSGEPEAAAEEAPPETPEWGAVPLGAEEPVAEELGALPLPPEEPVADELGAMPLPPEEPVADELGAMPLPPEEPVADELGAMPLPPEEPVAQDLGALLLTPEPFVEELGATPLDVAEMAELGAAEDAAPIELSSADVELLEPETPMEMELGGQPEDRVPLAGLHEFIGEQPEDPRALAFDDQGEQPTFAPEDLQASEAELAAAPEAFQQDALEALPELGAKPEPVPEPAPAAPRIVVPRPPAAPPPSRPAAAPPPPPNPPPARPTATAAPLPGTLPTPQSPPATVRAVATSAARAPAAPRQPTPAPPPPPAYVMSDDGRRLPALSPTPPEPPQLAHQFGGSGPFVRNKVMMLANASLDVMEEEDGLIPEPPPPPPPAPPPPATDVATGAEVFGGTYLNPTFVEGEHRVVLHTLEGQVRRGTVQNLDLLDPVIRLAQPGRAPEAIPAERVKAIFFMQEPGTPALPSAGRRIRVGFSDGRQIVGFSEDVDAGEQGFFLVPADTRTHTARIYVFRAGVQSISAA